MEKTKLLALIFWLLSFGAYAQEGTIEIDGRIFENAIRSLLLISDENGVVHYEEELTEPQLSDNYRLEFVRNPEVNIYHFTIFNEYVSEKINIGYHYYRACTYYGISNKVTADNFTDFDPHPELVAEPQDLLIEINGVDELNELIVHAPTPLNYERAKVRKGRLRIQYEHQKGSDLFVVLRCNDEENYRYFYFQENAIPGQVELDWASLSKELEHEEISLPLEEEWFCRIRAKNEDTQGYCYLFSSQRARYDQIRIFLPRKYFFYNFEVNLARHRKENEGYKSFQYLFASDELPAVKAIDEAEFEYSPNRIDKNGFELTAAHEAMKFKVRYRDLSFKPFQSMSDYGDLKFSAWHVAGDLDGPVSFTFPNIPLYHETNFESLKGVEGRAADRIQVIKPLGGKNQVIVSESLR